MPAVASLISRDAAIALVAGKTGKPGGVDPATWFKGDGADTQYALGMIPVSAFIPNEAGDRYDGTVDEERSRRYLAMASSAPPIIACFGRHDCNLRVLDGGHRMTAARIGAADSIATIVRFKPGQLEALRAGGGQAAIEQLGWCVAFRGTMTHQSSKSMQHTVVS